MSPTREVPVPDPDRLVHIVDHVPELEGVTELAMVLVLDGFLDAGNSAAIAARHLVNEAGGGRVVATFEVDEFHDYRARRPAMSFVRDHYEQYDAPRLVVRLLADDAGTPYLLMHGPEPDNKWEAFAATVRHVVERLGVSRVIGLGAVPMAVPHTRPIAITHHANNPELLAADSPWRGELRIPSSAQALLEVRLGESGHDTMGFVAHIPHYLAQLDFPEASVALLEQVERAAGIAVDLTDLRSAARGRDEEIATYLSANTEVLEVVQALEQQYDAFARAEQEGTSLLAEDEPIPTGEEIGRQFEQFLAGLDGPEDQT
jgi:predicted ATP-grasp superfamily ATP-dependent carboligase